MWEWCDPVLYDVFCYSCFRCDLSRLYISVDSSEYFHVHKRIALSPSFAALVWSSVTFTVASVSIWKPYVFQDRFFFKENCMYQLEKHSDNRIFYLVCFLYYKSSYCSRDIRRPLSTASQHSSLYLHCSAMYTDISMQLVYNNCCIQLKSLSFIPIWVSSAVVASYCWFSSLLVCFLSDAMQPLPKEVVEYHPTVFNYCVLVLFVVLMVVTFIFLLVNRDKWVLPWERERGEGGGASSSI